MVPVRSEGESELDYLRRKEKAFGLWQADALERIHDLESDLQRADEDRAKYRVALLQIHEALGVIASHAMLEGHELSVNDFARDFAPFKNVMAHHARTGVIELPVKKRKRG